MTFTAALRSDGTVWTWGVNNVGQLGDGSTTDRDVPVQVVSDLYGTPLKNIVSIAAGDHFTIALDNDGFVWAWGYNNVYQLGDGTSQNRGYAQKVLIGRQPHDQDSDIYLMNIRAIAAGDTFAGAVDRNGFVYTWGSNNTAQLGNASTANASTPVRVLAGVSAAGANQGSLTYRSTAVDQYLRDVVELTAGENHFVALRDDGSVYAWGSNGNGRLGTEYTAVAAPSGNSAGNYLSVPHPVTRAQNEPGRDDASGVGTRSRYLHEVLEITATDDASWYVNSQHQLLMSGAFTNHNGQNTTAYSALRPTYLMADSDILAVTPAGKYALTDGMRRMTNVYAISGGSDNLTFVTGTYVRRENAVWAMGLNNYGQLGRGYTINLNGTGSINGADDSTSAANDTSRQPTQVYAPFVTQPVDSRDMITLPNVVGVASGDTHNVFYRGDGSIYTVGLGTSGQLGHGEFTSQNLPVQAGGSDTNTVKPAYLEILSGGAPRLTYNYNINDGTGNMAPDFLSMGLREVLSIDPAKVCLQLTDGFNLYKDGYRIGLPQGVTVSFRSGDESIGVLRNVDANGVATGSRVELVSADGKKTGTVTLYITVTYQDGSFVAGQIRVTFVDMAVKETEVMVSSGNTHSAALAEDGTLWLWGSNANGQLGDETGISYYEYPYHLVVEENGTAVIFTAVEAGDGYTLAIDEAGALWAWGKDYTAVPTKVSDTERFAQVDTYMDRIIGLTTGGQAVSYTHLTLPTTPYV